METSKIDVLALASSPFRLAMVTMHGCCGGSRLCRPRISQIRAERLRCTQEGFGSLSKSRSSNGIPAAVAEQIGRWPRNAIGRWRRQVWSLYDIYKDELFCS